MLCSVTQQAVLLTLIQDLKDEGNQLFKEAQFPKASHHYRFALFVAQVLEERFYHEVEDDFMATLYSNGALSYLKTVSCFRACWLYHWNWLWDIFTLVLFFCRYGHFVLSIIFVELEAELRRVVTILIWLNPEKAVKNQIVVWKLMSSTECTLVTNLHELFILSTKISVTVIIMCSKGHLKRNYQFFCI